MTTVLDVPSIIRNNMRIEFDVAIPMSDATILRADVYRPIAEGTYPVIISYGPYGKLLHFEDGYPNAWRKMVETNPDVAANSTNQFQSWEVVDPEKWVPDGYVCVRVDSRGCGRSSGHVDIWSPQEAKDFAECIEWAGVQSWSNGKVGTNGISYYAMNQWQVAALKPKHLAAMCLWEGALDFYREVTHHGGIVCTFVQNWYDMQVKTVQHGVGRKGYRSRMNGEWVSGPETLPPELLGANRQDVDAEIHSHPLDDAHWQAMTPDPADIEVPLLSTANWGGQGLHLRGNIEGFLGASSPQKWLEFHGIEHWTHFYTDYGVSLQKRFFAHFLKGENNGWDRQPKIHLQVRHVDKFVERFEEEWPLPRTQWTKMHLLPFGHRLGTDEAEEAAQISFDAMGDGVTFISDPLHAETELTGPIAARFCIASSTTDADLFVTVRVFAPDFREVVFQGAVDPHTPIAQGWLRTSHRKLDQQRSTPYRPYHAHDQKQPLVPGQAYSLDVEVWPTCIVIPAGHRIGVSIRGRDYVYPGGSGGRLSTMKNEFTGCGPFLHDDPRDRPVSIFGGVTTIHFGEQRENFVLLPVVPKQ